MITTTTTTQFNSDPNTTETASAAAPGEPLANDPLPTAISSAAVSHGPAPTHQVSPPKSASPASVLTNLFGPLMLPESDDVLSDPLSLILNDPAPEPVLKKWSPDATTSQILNGTARDLADLISLLIARQRVAVGFQADHDSILLTLQLARSLRELTQINHNTELAQARKGGRPPKPNNLTPNTKPAGNKRPK